jgi:hypothetical protein
MQKYSIKTVLGNFDYEVITNPDGKEFVATISMANGKRYLKKSEVPAPVLAFLRKSGLKIELLNADILNELLGLCK